MTVLINDKEIEIFTGARVRDVLLKYSKEAYNAALSDENFIIDKNNNSIDLDGGVSEGQRLYTKKSLSGINK